MADNSDTQDANGDDSLVSQLLDPAFESFCLRFDDPVGREKRVDKIEQPHGESVRGRKHLANLGKVRRQHIGEILLDQLELAV